MRRSLAGVAGAVLMAMACLSGCRSQPFTGPVDEQPVGDFSLTERGGQTVTRADLLGKVWVASFIFTRCAVQCPLVSHNMARLQKDLAGQDGFLLVSFSVDPEDDTPAVLRDYADSYQADPNRWLFLTDKTGKQDEIYGLIGHSFHLPVQRAEGPDRTYGYEVGHSTRLALVDARGRVRGYYEGEKPDDLPRLEQDVKLLLWRNYLPTANAILNAMAAFLLALGFAAIRRGWVTTHKTFMLAALGMSALFLTSYLYYHIVVRRGQPKPFLGEGWERPAYFAVLLSHTLLAIVVAPLALVTAYLGLRGRLGQHVKIARWTLPLWLYVSITGVVVYLMLYYHYAPS